MCRFFKDSRSTSLILLKTLIKTNMQLFPLLKALIKGRKLYCLVLLECVCTEAEWLDVFLMSFYCSCQASAHKLPSKLPSCLCVELCYSQRTQLIVLTEVLVRRYIGSDTPICYWIWVWGHSMLRESSICQHTALHSSLIYYIATSDNTTLVSSAVCNH